MSNLPVEEKIKLLHNKAQQLIEENASDELIIKELMKEGIDRHYASTIAENVRNDKHYKKEYRKHILMGSFVTVAGLLTNYFSYKYSEKVGAGQFIIVWGVVVFGIVTIIRGVILFRK